MNEQLAKQILKVFVNNPFDAFNHKQISSRIGAGSKAERQEVIRTIQQLAEEKRLVEDDHKGKYKINPKSIDDELMPRNYVTGIIDMKQGGKAYVIPQVDERDPKGANVNLGEDIQIAPNNTHHALHGDTVKVLMFPQRKMHKPEGQVVEIIKRAKTRFVGVIQRQERFAFMVSDSRTMPVDIFIHIDDLGGAENGEKVLVEMTDWPERMNNPVGKVIKRLGRPGDNNVEMQSILAEYDFPLDFPVEVEEEAKKIRKPTKKEMASRRDFRDVTTFTIDPADAKDFDDALSYRELPNGHVEVGVHIADVSYYVKPGSAIDREAYERGTSVYLVDRTIPMLPEKLCNEVCSLRQDEEKLCFSVVMEMDSKAKVLNTWMGKTVIRSDRRMAYEEAQETIENGKWKNENSTDAVGEAILKLHALATILRNQRYKDGAINFETQEVKFQLDENAKPIGVYIKESKEANWLIEEFMLLANRSVAEYAGKTSRHQDIKTSGSKNSKSRSLEVSKTFVYRVHDEPNPEKLNTFVEFVAKLGFSMKTTSRKALAESYNRLFENIAGRGEEHMVDTIAIRTMSKAYYSTENIGHYGLAFRYYTHFTSPIRRYPDLMVHRLLEYYLSSSRQDIKTSSSKSQGLEVSKSAPDRERLEEACKHCSIMEKKASDAERTSIKYKQAEYLADKLGQVFPALISGVSKWGIYAEIEDSKCEGMIPIGSLKDDYYMLDEDNYQVIGRRHGRCYKLGYPVHIRVRRVDLLKKQIDFDLVEEEELSRPQRPASSKGNNQRNKKGKETKAKGHSHHRKQNKK
ncbi:MAG: ribonuclease R [Bacteroidales bacterium]|nr:ribonuclease R [Bacteroidales bacterium]